MRRTATPRRAGGRSRRLRLPASLLAGAVALLAGLAPAAVAAPSPTPSAASSGAAATAEAADAAPRLTLQTLTPAVARPSDHLTLTVKVTNPTPRALKGATLDLAVDWARITQRSALADWADGDSTRRLSTQLHEPVPELAPGASTTVTLALAVDALHLGQGARGPRALAVTLHHGGDTVAELRTFLLWDPQSADDAAADATDPVRLSLLAPVTGPAVDPANPLSTDRLAGVTAPGGALARTLAAVEVAQQSTGTHGALALAVDPALVATAAASDDAQISAWAGAVAQRGDVTDVYPLPPYDPDLAALAHGKLSDAALQAATSTPLPGGWTVPPTWGPPLAWPAGTTAPDLVTLAAARTAGLGTAVLPTGFGPTSGTVTGRATVPTPEGDVAALVADRTLSRVLTEATDTASAPAAESTAQSVQRLLAETSVVATQRAGDEPHLLAVLPRGWAPDVDALRTTLAALTSSGWVQAAPVSALLATDPPQVNRIPLRDSEPQDDELSPGDVRRLDVARTELDDLAAVAHDPNDIIAPLAPALAAPTSVAWRAAPEARAAAVTAAVDAVKGTRGSLSVSATDVTLISASGALPVIVTNTLPTDATVTVVLRPDTQRLVVDSHPTQVVPANGQARFDVPVRALGSGDVEVTVQVLTPNGAEAAAPITLRLNVQAGWETAGTAVAAVAVGLLFVAGIWRTVKRGRSARRTVDSAVTDPVIPSDAERSR
ncbi:DUF6049 family protein [Xylanimonas protaetiae]|uniref:Glycoprotein n=1 Tax=Xylanimonas protaetiae TaxID=2509457 RepID=A0A4P6F5J5_9MICO|nr:DUF6049 family protein [Xylanimonas protaetiae]QAY69519.1 hypothetical protein ET471_05225 [Xylanimonas protaetiae]